MPLTRQALRLPQPRPAQSEPKPMCLELIKRKKLYENKDKLIDNMNNFLKINNKNSNFEEDVAKNFINEKIEIEKIDYYHSNVIARASKNLNECSNVKIKMKSTGTDG